MRELYEFRIGTEIFRYCSGEIDIVFGGNTYTKQAITRNEVSRSFENESAIIELPYHIEPAPRYRVINPTQSVSVKILKENGVVLFIGKILSCNFNIQKGVATFNIISLQGMMKTQIPSRTYGTGCSFRLFDANCKVVKNSYKLTIQKANMTISNDKIKITASALNSDFTGGFIEFNNEQNFIVSQNGTTITLLYPMQTIDSATSVNFYKGCKKTLTACRAFSNEKNYGGFPFVPAKNPMTQGL